MRWTWNLRKLRQSRRRAEALAAAERVQRAEHEAARQRILAAARRHDRAMWNGPTQNMAVAPLLTRGQAARTRQRDRW